ncbi:MAG: isocitrate dehydrogenase kinase/phosphatase AceK regulatory subunit, partial [Acidimicrobiia bacterium]
LRTLMPRKRAAELYIATGHHKHGKTELYRDLLHHLQHSVEQFEPAPGVAGMVMVVFTLPGYDVVFKVLRDRFPPQKRLTRLEVRERYRLVFRHDRAGRLVEAQEFEHLELDQARFHAALLEEVLHEAGRTVHLVGNRVVVDHVYVERRVTPLDVYLRVSNPEAARAAVLDYGQAIKDLASTDIFPGDVLLKNFGVTRHGRVVFYDYDELELMSAVRFRDLPPPSSLDEEMAAAPWFGVGTNDVFPEEFASFLGLSGELRKVFDTHHWQLFDTSFWRQMQSRLTAGDLVDILPYPARRRLRAGGPGNRIQGSEK